jgi:hypothetical protein
MGVFQKQAQQFMAVDSVMCNQEERRLCVIKM